MNMNSAAPQKLEFDAIVFCIAGTPRAFEVLGPVEVVQCHRCGAHLTNVFVADGHPYGGDCLATLTGEPGYRAAVRKATRAAERLAGWIADDRGQRLVGVAVEPSLRDANKSSVSLRVQPLGSWNDFEGRYMDPERSRHVATVPSRLGLAVAASVADAIGANVI
jgi:hypothetical protein